MADSDYNIKITTTGDPAGALAVAKSLEALKKASGDAGKEAKNLGTETEGLSGELKKLGSRNNEAKDVIEGIETASRGGAAGLFGLAKTAKNLWEILGASTPLGRVIQLVAVAGAAFLALREKLLGTAEANAEAAAKAEETKKKFEEETTAAQRLNGIKLDAFKEELASIGASASAALNFSQALLDIQNKLAESKMGVELASIEADAALTPEQKKLKSSGVRQRYADLGFKRSQESSDNELSIRQRQATETAAAAQQAEERVAAQRGLVTRAREAPDELAKQIADYKKELAALQKRPGGTDSAANFRGDLMQLLSGRIGELEKYSAARATAASSPGALKDITEQKKHLTDLEAQAKSANDAAKASSDKLAEFAQIKSLKDANAPTIRGLDDRKRTIEDSATRREAETRSVAEAARDLASRAPGVIRPEVFKDDFSISGDARKANRSRIESENAARYYSLDHSVEAIGKITAKLGDGKGERDDFAALVAAIEALAAATQARQSGAIQNLVARVKNLESQQRNGDRFNQ